MSCWNSYDVISRARYDLGEGGLQEAARVSRGLAHRWSLDTAAAAAVRWEDGDVRAVTRVELGSVLSRIAMSHVQESTIF
jgi:urease beta subunit